MKHADLTEKIIEACFEVMNELGAGFLESVYEKSLLVALKEKGFLLNFKFRSKSHSEEKSLANSLLM